MSDRKKSKVKGITFAPFLKELNGHVKDYHTSLQKQFGLNGWESVTILPEDCPLRELGDQWKKGIYNPPKWSRRSIFAKACPLLVNCKAFYKLTQSLWKVLKKEIDPSGKTILFFETFNTFHLYALSFLLPFLPIKNLSLWIVYRYDSKQLFFKGKKDRKLLNLIENILVKRKLKLFADTDALQKELSVAFKRTVHLVPIPHTCGIKNSSPQKERMNLWWPGVPRRPKGLHLIQKMTGYQAPEDIAIKLRLSEKTQNLQASPSFCIERVPENLTRVRYLDLFSKSDVILMPYNAWNYRYSSSGIFIETIFAKKLPVVSKGLWISNELKKYGLDDCIVDFENPNLLFEIQRLFLDQNVAEKLKVMSEAYQGYHTEENFAKLLRNHV